MQDTSQHSRVLALSSADSAHDADRHHQSGMTVVLKEHIHASHPEDRICVKLISAQIPFSFYTCTEKNNKIKLSTAEAPYSIPKGNYNVSSLKTALNTLLVGFTVTYNETQAKFTITNNAGNAFTIDPKTPNSARVVLGFSAGFSGASSPSVTSDNVVDVTGGLRCLYVRSSLMSNTVLTGSSAVSSDILAVVPITTNAGGVIMYTSPNPSSLLYTANKTLTHVDIKVTEEHSGDTVDMNGNHWTCEIEISFCREHTENSDGYVGKPRSNLSYLRPLNFKKVDSTSIAKLLESRQSTEKAKRVSYMQERAFKKNIAKSKPSTQK